MSKAQIIDQSLEKCTLQEKMVLENVNFPLIIKLYRTFKDKDFVYFLLQFVNGIELFEAIRQIDLLEPYQCAYYIGSMLLSIEYLHNQKIVYRDIKPENLMVHHATGQLF